MTEPVTLVTGAAGFIFSISCCGFRNVEIMFLERRCTLGQAQRPNRLCNIGNHQPVEILRFIEVLEEATGKKDRSILCHRSRTSTGVSDLKAKSLIKSAASA